MEPISNSKDRFDLERLNQIPIDEILEVLGAERVGKSKKFHCFNEGAHKASDKSASLAIHPKKNYCKCFGCGVGGGPVSLITEKMNGDFVAACEWLHDTFRIPYLDGARLNERREPIKNTRKEIEYLSFDPLHPYNEIDVDEWLPYYQKLNDERRLKLVYTAIYRFSLQTDQRPKVTYHSSRGIDPDHPMQAAIGYLSAADIKKLGRYLDATFPKEDLVRFNLYSPLDRAYYPGTWKYHSKTGFCVVPSMDLYTDMCNGFMLRNTDADPSQKRLKEIQVSCSEISQNLPFGLTRELLLAGGEAHVTEGYIDGLSLGRDKRCIAATGVYGLKEPMYGLLKGLKIRLAHDMDNAGSRVKHGYWTISVRHKNKTTTRYFPRTLPGEEHKDRYIGRLGKWTGLEYSERTHAGIAESMKKAGVAVEPLDWEPKIPRVGFIGDINEILKEYRKIYHCDLTGKSVEQAVGEIHAYHGKKEVGMRSGM